ncbi:RNA-binding protein 44 isoform X2 [Bubalus kerabau]|uniref:RNA-binding protein 44 isoform X2 n=1 Tax=Bubalus carabanensis TaxID=3119969 RepID=UPI00244E7D04|nr:RNA-binding protein 44 isoform X2 [Bubalus carabanensis]
MQATAVVETASNKGYNNNGRNIQKDEPSHHKKENLLSPNGCKEAKLTFLNNYYDSLALEKRANDKEISNIDKIDLLEPSFTMSPDTNIESAHSQSSEFEDSIDYAFLNETYTIHYSESKLKSESLIHLNSELDSEMQKREEVFFDILEHQGDKTTDLERIYKISCDDYKKTAEDVQKPDIDEDSQQEYHSAEEQECINNHLSFDQAKTLDVPNLEVLGLRNSGCEVKCASNLEDSHVKLESNSSISLDSVDVYGQEDSPSVSKFQNSVMLRAFHEPKYEKCKEQGTSLMLHTVLDEIVLRSSHLEHKESQSKGFLNPQKALKTKIYTHKVNPQLTESKDSIGNVIVEDKMLQHLDNPGTLPQDKDLETLLQPCKDCQTSSVFDDSVISACGYSHYESLQSTPNPALDVSITLPRSAIRGSQAVEESGSLEAANGNTISKAHFHNMEGPCPKSQTDAAGCTVTVDQTVDVSTDFRACFTASRATSARSFAVSTSSNTEITMMNKKWPSEWQSEKQRSVACNTDWSYIQDTEDPQMAMTKGPAGKSLSVDNLKPNGNVLNKDSLELKTFEFTDLKKHSERESQLPEEVEKNLPSKCCQQIMQRAMQAESHLLDVHYQLCHRHCSDVYRLVTEGGEGLNRKHLKSFFFPSLSLQLMKEESHIFSGADSELDNQSTRVVGSSSLKKTLSQTSLLLDNGHPKQDKSPKEGGLKNGDIDVDLSQLKLDDKDCKNYREVSEDWFDAKENLTGADFSGMQENQIEQDKGDPKFTLEIKNVEPLRKDKGYLMHVGGLCPSVSEADLRSYFQKYEISDISIYDSSPNYRYASLAFKKNSDAKMAVKEMNGIEIKGKSVNVRLVKTPGEYTPLSSKNGNKVSFSNLEKSTSKEISSPSSVSRLPRTRPRQPGSEQDSEFFPFDQKGVKKNCKQIESTKLLPDTPIQFIPPKTLNLRSFTKIIKRLAELHPEVSRDHIIDALQEVRVNHKGFLNGLSINTIVEMTSSVLENSASS